MKRPITLTLLALFALSVGTTVQANDIEDFFKAAIRGSNHRGHDRHDDRRYRSTSFRGARHDDHRYHDHGYDVRPRRSSSFNISIGLNNSRFNGPRVATTPVIVAPVPRYPVIEAPRPILSPAPVPRIRVPSLYNHGPSLLEAPYPAAPAPVGSLYVPGASVNPLARFGYGDIVDCPVPLFARVRVRDRDNIHPRAVDIVVAVKDPNACSHACTCCTNRTVFVPLCVPPCPLEKVKVSRDGTRMELDYGDYEIDITSRNGLVTVDYDD